MHQGPMTRQLAWYPLHCDRPSSDPAPAPAPPRRADPPEDPEFPIRPSTRDRHSRDRPDITEQARRQLEANGQDAVLALIGVLQQNFDLRDERRELNDEIQRNRPQPGEVRLNRDQAQAWQGYQSFNLSPDQVHALMERDQQRTVSDARRANDERADQAADLLQLAPKVLRRLVRQDDLEVELKTVTRPKAGGAEGEKERIEVPYVKKAGATEAAVPLEEYAEAQWDEDFGAALRARPGEEGPREGATSAPDRAPRVVPLPRSGPAGRVRTGEQQVTEQLARKYPLPDHLVTPGAKRD